MANLGNKATSSPAGLGFGGRPIGTISEVKSSQEVANPYYVAPQKYMVDSSSPAQKEEREHGNYLQRNIEMLKGGYRAPTFDDAADMGKLAIYGGRRQTGGTVFEDEQGANPFGEGHRYLRWGNLPGSATNETQQYTDSSGVTHTINTNRGMFGTPTINAPTHRSIASVERAAQAQRAVDTAEKAARDKANSARTREEAEALNKEEQAAKQDAWNKSRDNPGEVATTAAEAAAQLAAERAKGITTIEQARQALKDEMKLAGGGSWQEALASIRAQNADPAEGIRQQNAWNASRDNPNQPNWSTAAERAAATAAEQNAQQDAWNASRDNPAPVERQNPWVRPNTAPQSTIRNIISQLGGAGVLGAGGWGGGMNRQPESIFSNTPTMIRGTGNL